MSDETGKEMFIDPRIQESYKEDLAKAEQGDAHAQYKVAYYYRMHYIHPYDIETVRYWLNKSAEQGNQDAVKELELVARDEIRDKMPKPYKDPARGPGGGLE